MGRRSFATSVVVTVSLLELGCSPGGGTGSQNPPPDEELEIGRNPPDPSGPEAEAGDEGEVADTGAADDGAETPQREPTIFQRGGECFAVVDIDCEPGATCNPPPPQRVPCPHPGATGGEGVAPIDAVVNEAPPETPPETPPKTPPADLLPKASAGSDVRQVGEGVCMEYRKTKCPPGARCNPPPPRRVQCPPELGGSGVDG